MGVYANAAEVMSPQELEKIIASETDSVIRPRAIVENKLHQLVKAEAAVLELSVASTLCWLMEQLFLNTELV
jgi:hypothetical protein